MPANYDNAAWFYDGLAAVVYGNSLNKAQQYFLHHVSENSKILIAGGGTGKILEHLSQIHPFGLQITYAEISANMIALAKKRNTQSNKVEFITAAVENVSLTAGYDVIITPFLFDNFKEDTVKRVFGHLNKALKSNGIWLNTDFQLTGKWWQNILLRSMMLFFRMLCGVESTNLPDMKIFFQNAGYEAADEKTFYGDFIVSTAYKKA